MTRCWRCGVDFNQTGLPTSYPCGDCRDQLPEPPNIWRDRNRKIEGGLPFESVMEARGRLIREQWILGKTDPEIAAALGISPQTAFRYRKKHNLGKNSSGGGSTPEQMERLHAGFRRWRASVVANAIEKS